MALSKSWRLLWWSHGRHSQSYWWKYPNARSNAELQRLSFGRTLSLQKWRWIIGRLYRWFGRIICSFDWWWNNWTRSYWYSWDCSTCPRSLWSTTCWCLDCSHLNCWRNWSPGSSKRMALTSNRWMLRSNRTRVTIDFGWVTRWCYFSNDASLSC